MHQGAGEPGQYPGGVDGLLAPLGMADQHGEQCAGRHVQPVQPPGHPQPVSSACTSSAAASPATAAAVNGSSPAAARAVHAATVPVDIGVPNNSASNPAVRSTGRC